LDDGNRLIGVSCVLRSTHKTRLPPSAASVVWVRTMWGGLGQVFGASRLFTTRGVTIAIDVHDIVPGLSPPVIVTNFGAREVVLRKRASVGYIGLLTTGVVQVPHGASHGTTPTPASTTPTAAEGVVGAVSGTRCDPTPERSPDTTTPTDRGPGTPAQPRDPGKGGALPAAKTPALPPQVEDVDSPDADPAPYARIRRMLDQHKAVWTGQCSGSRHHHVGSASCRSDLLISSVRRRNCPGNGPTAQPHPNGRRGSRQSPGGNRSPKHSWFYQTATGTARRHVGQGLPGHDDVGDGRRFSATAKLPADGSAHVADRRWHRRRFRPSAFFGYFLAISW